MKLPDGMTIDALPHTPGELTAPFVVRLELPRLRTLDELAVLVQHPDRMTGGEIAQVDAIVTAFTAQFDALARALTELFRPFADALDAAAAWLLAFAEAFGGTRQSNAARRRMNKAAAIAEHAERKANRTPAWKR